MPKKTKEGAVVVFSGGLDSTTCLALACQKHGVKNVLAVTFSYGQRHDHEVKVAQDIAGKFKVRHEVYEIEMPKQKSSLLKDSAPGIKHDNKYKPVSFVKGRNGLFLLHAAVIGIERGMDPLILYTGVHEEESKYYPDTSESFIRAQEYALRIGLDYDVRIEAPLVHLDKVDTLKLAANRGIFDVVKQSYSCYAGTNPPCGKCLSCKVRAKAFEDYYKSED